MGGKDICQVGLPGFPSTSNNQNRDEFNSYDFVITSNPISNTYIADFVKVQKSLLLTVNFGLRAPTPTVITNFIFNGVNELIGATDLKIGLLNPPLFAVQVYTLVGSTLTVGVILNFPTGPDPFPLPIEIIFSISYTPAA